MKSWKRDSKFCGSESLVTSHKERARNAREGAVTEGRRRLACVINGNVQGIGFRWSVRELAARLGMTGYARNLGDGRMEVVAEGSEAALETLRAFCYRGPDGATVTGVEATESPATGEFPHFEIR